MAKNQPLDIVIVAAPQFNLAATTAFIDPLRAANYLRGEPRFRWELASQSSQFLIASNGLQITATRLEDLARTPDLAIVSSSWTPEAHADKTLLTSLRKWARFGAWMGGIDTGAFILAEAGLLNGRRATVHYEHINSFRELYPEVELTDALFVFDHERLTTCGGTASIDLGLRLIEATQGVELAEAAAAYIFHDRLRDPSEQQYADSRRSWLALSSTRLRTAIELMEQHLEEPLKIGSIADATNLSQRQLERLFRRHSNKTAARYYVDLRLDRARSLLTQTDMAIADIAIACGFLSPGHFSRAYKRRFQKTPQTDRIDGRIPFEMRAWPINAGPAR